MKHKKTKLVKGLCWSLLMFALSGCVTGGNVDLTRINTKPVIDKPAPPKPSKDEVIEVAPREDGLPKNGFAFKNPSTRFVEDRAGRHYLFKYIEAIHLVKGDDYSNVQNRQEARNTLMNIRAENSYALDESTSLDTITFKHATYWEPAKSASDIKMVDKTITGLTTTGSRWEKYGDFMRYLDDDGYVNEEDLRAILNFDYTQMGFVGYNYTNHFMDHEYTNATLFYRGINRAQSLPVTSSARYTGNWAYMVPMTYYAARNRETGTTGRGGNLSLGHSKSSFVAEFDVNFAEKKLNGTLKTRTNGTETEYFGINANIQGNQFSGKAVAKQGQDNELSKALSNDSDALFGGFYGDKGQELGGGFYTLADKSKPNGDKTLAVAFIAKNNAADVGTTAKLSDGTLLSWAEADAEVSVTDLGAIDNIKQLALNHDGKRVVIDLNNKNTQTIDDMLYEANACCDNYQFLRFGTLSQAKKGPDGKALGRPSESLFVQGELTPPAEVPTTGQAHYVGKWQMRTLVQSTAINSGADVPFDINYDATYRVDFGKKELIGALVGETGLTPQGEVQSGVTPWINIKADIKGNQFVGTAVMPKSQQIDDGLAYKPIEPIVFNEVKGGLYGPGAAELGGQMTSTDGKTGVVFAGKKQATN
ncbi:transferrin-binding protein-like solute binding protein [Suttonella sp. R2A3]|uniref:transferrin-binding protein-like solute binding protein n=1 Tax=Suttonella sp. R2A3 TaxID=2908648 RepID=UPI001F294D1A|nr:transferrin-binding protein-like solute binding protein [Suttonella sp. R2A3]UJF23964.1 transferrin-binding protein-like solute binding protein [Suttonella sp. R2A3]